MPIFGNQPKYTVQSTFEGVANEFVYGKKVEKAITNGVEKLNKSVFGNKSKMSFDISTAPSSLATVHDSNIDFINDSGTKAGFVKNLTGMYEMNSYEASINYSPSGNTVYQAFANIDGTVGAGVKFKNGDRITGAYTFGSGAELAYSTDSGIMQTKTGVFYDKNRQSTGVSNIIQARLASNISFGSGISVDSKGNWSASVQTNISQKHSNVKLNAGVQNDSGAKSGFVGAIITF